MDSENDFANVVCSFFNVRREDLYGETRKREVTEARQALWYLLYRSGMTYKAIAVRFGRGECTILMGIST